MAAPGPPLSTAAARPTGTATRSIASAPCADSDSTGTVASAPASAPVSVRVVAVAVPVVTRRFVASSATACTCSPRVMYRKRSKYSGRGGDERRHSRRQVPQRGDAVQRVGEEAAPCESASFTKAASAPSSVRPTIVRVVVHLDEHRAAPPAPAARPRAGRRSRCSRRSGPARRGPPGRRRPSTPRAPTFCCVRPLRTHAR